MGDYIKREDAKRAIRSNFHDFGTRCMINNIINEIAKVSSNNLVEVVRCKDCKYWDNTTKWAVCTKWSADPYEQATTEKNDFCSYGERAEE